MKHILFVLLLTGLSSMLFAQETTMEIPVEKLKATECLSVKSPNGTVFLIFEERKQLRIVELDSTLKERQQFSVPMSEVIRFGEYVGTIATEHALTLFYSFGSNQHFRAFHIDYKTHTTTSSEILLSFSSKEKFMDAFEQNHGFYVLSMPKLSKVIHVYTYNAVIGQFERTAFDFDPLSVSVNMYERFILNKNVPLEMGLHRVISDIPYGLGNTCYRDKFYTFNQKLVFTSDLSRNTHILTLDLATKQPGYEKVAHQIPEGLPLVTNSMLYKNYLFQLAYTTDHLVVQIWDMEKNQIMQKFDTSKGDSISFANTAIIQERNTSSDLWGDDKDIRQLSFTRQLLRKMVNSSGAIAINPYTTTTLTMTIGSYKEVTSRGGHMMPMGGPTMISTPSGMVQTGMYRAPMYVSYGQSSLNKSAYFKSLLDASSLVHTLGRAEQKSAFEKMQDVQERLQANAISTAETIFKQGDTYVFGFYNKNTKKYMLMRFE